MSDFFDDAYELETAEQTAAHYARFAADYETAMRENGYATPQRCADALQEVGVATNAAILDIGCGTGLSGEALRAAGYQTLDGIDFSAEMLAFAREKGIYRTLTQGGLDALPNDMPSDAAIAAGVFSPGHAAASLIDEVLERLGPEGVFVFSLNDHAVTDGSYDGRVHELIDAGGAELLFREYGPHMPGQHVQAWVLALRRRG